MKAHYHVRHEMAGGYMPDEVVTFDNLQEARDYVASELRRWRDDCATEKECDDSQTGDPGIVETVCSESGGFGEWRIRYESEHRLDYLLILDKCYESGCEVGND